MKVLVLIGIIGTLGLFTSPSGTGSKTLLIEQTKLLLNMDLNPEAEATRILKIKEEDNEFFVEIMEGLSQIYFAWEIYKEEKKYFEEDPHANHVTKVLIAICNQCELHTAIDNYHLFEHLDIEDKVRSKIVAILETLEVALNPKEGLAQRKQATLDLFDAYRINFQEFTVACTDILFEKIENYTPELAAIYFLTLESFEEEIEKLPNMAGYLDAFLHLRIEYLIYKGHDKDIIFQLDNLIKTASSTTGVMNREYEDNVIAYLLSLNYDELNKYEKRFFREEIKLIEMDDELGPHWEKVIKIFT